MRHVTWASASGELDWRGLFPANRLHDRVTYSSALGPMAELKAAPPSIITIGQLRRELAFPLLLISALAPIGVGTLSIGALIALMGIVRPDYEVRGAPNFAAHGSSVDIRPASKLFIPSREIGGSALSVAGAAVGQPTPDVVVTPPRAIVPAAPQAPTIISVQ